MATNLKLKGNWNILKGKLKEKYGELTDDDLAYVEGQEDQLLGKIQKRTGEAEETIKKEFFEEY
ncbi:CsbD family protein [Algoriphagus halophytocola]|uniref:CsbD family protein n=1 Tax=Algoriphagus halophytocola TaxID=2991499 RepID=A0ABY6MEM0_9BACT|nr:MULTISPECIES: CsbD family protein [unclassified Algoriphagus]UZD22253.1 CsbD family protein [Algoriphagus sp. TR-M5]WBL43501.1 CsbD family protein [Algoriphagus sp. TR-M9]